MSRSIGTTSSYLTAPCCGTPPTLIKNVVDNDASSTRTRGNTTVEQSSYDNNNFMIKAGQDFHWSRKKA